MATNELRSRPTAAFHLQAVISFGVSVTAMVIGIAYLPANAWIRAFLALGLLYVVTASLTLAKVIRDQHEASTVLSRVDEAKLEKLLADHDPFRTPAL
jgi:hypothetical protein